MKAVLVDIDKEGVNQTQSEIKELGGECIALDLDVSVKENVQKVYDVTMDSYGQVDMLVNSAGVAVGSHMGTSNTGYQLDHRR